jgi:hypothetical protein
MALYSPDFTKMGIAITTETAAANSHGEKNWPVHD